MKKLTLLLVILFSSGLAGAQSVAKNFNCNDCSGNNHDLFTELDAGNVVVLCWVMPCPACVGPATSAHNSIQTYSASHPGKVKFYICDDYGDTNCGSLNAWIASNGITTYTSFSNSSIKMSD